VVQGDELRTRKRTKSHSKTGNDRRKSRRVTAGEGLANVADSMQIAMHTLASSISQASGSKATDPSSQKAAAIEAIEDNEGLSDDEFNHVVEMIMASADIANMYLAIKRPAARTRFLQSQLEKLS
jgi:alpha-glucuronidase